MQPDKNTIIELLQLVEDSLEQAKSAYAELASERQEKTRLEKIASTRSAVDPAAVRETVDLLVEHNYIDEGVREKLAAEICANPANVLRFTNRLIQISVPAYSEGRGVPKEASFAGRGTSSSDENSLWQKCVTSGA